MARPDALRNAGDNAFLRIRGSLAASLSMIVVAFAALFLYCSLTVVSPIVPSFLIIDSLSDRSAAREGVDRASSTTILSPSPSLDSSITFALSRSQSTSASSTTKVVVLETVSSSYSSSVSGTESASPTTMPSSSPRKVLLVRPYHFYPLPGGDVFIHKPFFRMLFTMMGVEVEHAHWTRPHGEWLIETTQESWQPFHFLICTRPGFFAEDIDVFIICQVRTTNHSTAYADTSPIL
jgi:hypothetical protein